MSVASSGARQAPPPPLTLILHCMIAFRQHTSFSTARATGRFLSLTACLRFPLACTAPSSRLKIGLHPIARTYRGRVLRSIPSCISSRRPRARDPRLARRPARIVTWTLACLALFYLLTYCLFMVSAVVRFPVTETEDVLVLSR